MSDPNLLERLSKGKTQNHNEALHGVIWSHCPKTVFVGRSHLDASTARGVASYPGHRNLRNKLRNRAGKKDGDLSKLKQARQIMSEGLSYEAGVY